MPSTARSRAAGSGPSDPAAAEDSAPAAASWWDARLPNDRRPVEGRSARSMNTREPSENAPRLRPGSLWITPRIWKVCVPISSSSPSRRLSCASSSGRTSTPWLRSSSCEYGCPLQRHRPVERKGGLHGAQFDHSRRRRRPLAEPSSPARRLRTRRRRGRSCARARPPRESLAERPIASHDDIGAGHGSCFSRQSLAHALNDRANRHDRGDADGDAHEEEQQPLPGRPDLAQRHSDDERHRAASAQQPVTRRCVALRNRTPVAQDQSGVGE